jgi:hypothetical protein
MIEGPILLAKVFDQDASFAIRALLARPPLMVVPGAPSQQFRYNVSLFYSQKIYLGYSQQPENKVNPAAGISFALIAPVALAAIPFGINCAQNTTFCGALAYHT